MKPNKNSFYFSFEDFFYFLQQRWKGVLFATLFGALAFFFWRASRPTTFTAEALMKSSFSASSMNKLNKALELFTNVKSEQFQQAEDPKMYLRSYPVAEYVVLTLGLQGSLSIHHHESFISRLWNHLKTEQAAISYQERKRPHSPILDGSLLISDSLVLPDKEDPLKIGSCHYHGEVFSELFLTFTSEDTFSVFDQNKQLLGTGSFGIPFVWQEGSFMLERASNQPLPQKTTRLTLIPLPYAAASIQKGLKIHSNKDQPSLVHLQFSHRDRHLAARIVNTAISGYYVALKEEGRKKLTEQLAFLEEREKVLLSSLQSQFLAQHNSLLCQLDEEGFLVGNDELEFLSHLTKECQTRLSQLCAEIMQLFPCSQHELPFVIQKQRNKKTEQHTDEEIVLLPLKEAQSLLSTLKIDYETSLLNRLKYHSLLERLESSGDFLCSFVSSLDEPLLKSSLDKIYLLSLQLIETSNWTDKERERKKKELDSQKELLIFQLTQLQEGCKIQETALNKKIEKVKDHCLTLLVNEYERVRDQLKGLALHAINDPESWMQNKKLNLSTATQKKVLESVLQLMEAKDISFHTEMLDASCLKPAFPPIFPKMPLLRLFFFLGAFVGVVFACVIISLDLLIKGPRATPSQLKAFGYPTMGVWAEEEACYLTLLQQLTKGQISLHLCQKRTFSLGSFMKWLSLAGEKVLHIEIAYSPQMESSSSEGEPPIQKTSSYDSLLLTLTPSFFTSPSLFLSIFERLRENYTKILITNSASLSPPILSLLTSVSPSTFFHVFEEFLRDLESLPPSTSFFVHTKEENPLKAPSQLVLLIDKLIKPIEKVSSSFQ